ncbi:dual serine/threonine and tyrosine protein kinase-like [Centruroides vittatus]|uniref:dual serine/threonine and tyrosine protein kinase-like n=1 Tax=Centruroides vittatus TaxID=120091 RepID=UPI00350EE0F1
MAANLPHEFNRYAKYCKHLRRILKDTRHSFEDIARSGYFDEEQLLEIRLKPKDVQTVQEVLFQSVGIVILGQSFWAKSCVANELFGQPILPTVPSGETEKGYLNWRMVRFKYGTQTQVSLALPNSYELVEHLVSYDKPWHTVPLADLKLKEEIHDDPALESAVLEINLHHSILKDDVQIVVSPSNCRFTLEQFYDVCTEGLSPILIYAIESESLNQREITELIELKRKAPKSPIFFICARPQQSCELTESEQHARSSLGTSTQTWSHSYQERSPLHHYQLARKRRESFDVRLRKTSLTLFQQLCGLGFLNMLPQDVNQKRHRRYSGTIDVDSELVENFENFPSILLYVRQNLQARLVNIAKILNDAHNRCLRMFIMSAFSMTWDMIITPKRLDYARQREAELYESLMKIANENQDEIRKLIVETIDSMKEELLERASKHEFQGVQLSGQSEPISTRDLHVCTTEIQDLVLGTLNSAVAGKLIGSVDYLRESFIGTLERCLGSLEKVCKESGESVQASNALKQILNAAYQVEVTVKTSSTFLRALFEKMKQLVQALPWKTPPHIDKDWKRKVASDMLASLSPLRLSRSICSQFRERLKTSHDHFAASLRQLEAIHSGRLERTEEQRLKVRKVHAPRIAKYALESTSLTDMILFGMPQIGREIGRGQYGVVYACDSWGGFSPCAIKSVVPPDDKHWNDLAMEFYYTRSIPEHDRIVQISGSVIDHSYGSGSTPAVLLIMERLQRDLYSAIKMGLDWMCRLQVALDVVEGIRFLHSQGLVHRDIKLKNVLLDKRNRAKITDLGFCKPEAMMSGSIVGTPIHMAPELFSGRYDNSVDVYAFGILFWYICAGHVKLPYVFEQCQSKDQLWNAVRRGARPERLPQFDDDCWQLMEECWAGDPGQRPLLGDVEPRLTRIMERYMDKPAPSSRLLEKEVGFLSSSPYIDLEFCPG